MPQPRLIQSRVLQVPHGFTTRHQGYSVGMFSTLNFGNPGNLPREQRDPPETIAKNFGLVLEAAGCGGRERVEVHQVHGGEVHEVPRGAPAHPAAHDTKADAMVTDDPRRMLVIRVADCAPVLLAGESGAVVGAVHAGWRGVVAGVVPRTVEVMRRWGAKRLAAAVGPCISAEHFEVGPEVAAEFERVFGAGTPVVRTGYVKPHIDLKLAIRLQLEAAGVAAVDVLPHCTYEDGERFFSHRRDRGRTGRMIGLIGTRS